MSSTVQATTLESNGLPGAGGAARPLIPERAGDWILAGVWTALGALALFDKATETARNALLAAALGLLVLLDAPSPRHWFSGATRKRLAFVFTGIVAATVIGEVQRLFGGGERKSFGVALERMLDFRGWAVLAVTLWVYFPIAAQLAGVWRRSEAATGDRAMPEWAILAGTALAAFTLWSFATCFSSLDPKTSFRHFPVDAGAYGALFIHWIRAATRRPRVNEAMIRCGGAILAAGAAAAGIVLAAYWLGDEALRRRVLEIPWPYNGMVTVDPAPGGGQTARLTFPFGHHNRLAFFSMIASLGLAGAAVASRRAGWAILCAAGAAVAVLDLLFTLNRGAMAGFAAGAAALAVAALGRRAWFLALLPALAWPLAPAPQKDRIRSMVQPETYTRAEGTWWLRAQHFKTAGAMIAEHPVIGIGYGWKHFEEYYLEFCTERGIPVHEAVHAHNIWLETAAESGIPAATLFLLFHAARWFALAQALMSARRLGSADRRRLAAWIGLEVAMQLFCLVNYPLRRSLGLIAWGAWSVMTADLIRMHWALETPDANEGVSVGR